MVSIIKQKIGNQTYYYLTHHNRSKINRRYLGKKIPPNIAQIKKEFLLQFYREQWNPKLEQIRSEYIKTTSRMPAQVKKEQLKHFAINFIYDTQKIEGSSLTRLDTVRLLRDGLTPTGKPKNEMIETELAEDVFYEMIEHKRKITLDTIKYWHARMFNKTKLQFAGQIRDYDVYVSGSKTKFPSSDQVHLLLQQFFKWYHDVKTKINPVELAALSHLKFETIHPFGDGNGRVGRLLMNCILDENNYPMLNILFAERRKYYSALERSNLQNDDMPFLRWFMKKYITSKGY